MKQTTKVPGEAKSEDGADEQVRSGVTALNNTTGTTANSVGQQHEALAQANAAAEAARQGVAPQLAPAAAIGEPAPATSTKRKAVINGVEVMVDVPVQRKNSAVEQFGRESKHPAGTLVNEDGSVYEGSEQAYGIIGHIDTPQGKLVNRIIPFDSVKAAA